MSETNGVDGVSQKRTEFLDSGQYTINGITRYERIFGRNYVSEGGLQSTQVSWSVPSIDALIVCSWAL